MHDDPHSGEGSSDRRHDRDPHEANVPRDLRNRIRRELIEQLPDSPEEPSDLVRQLKTAAQTSILQAHMEGRAIDRDDANVLTELLSFALDAPDGALRSYRRGLDDRYDDARAELVELAGRPTLRLEMREVINWAASYLLYEQAPALAPSNSEPGERWNRSIASKPELGLTVAFSVHGIQDEAIEQDVLDRMTRFLLYEGVPGLAYLRLPDVDASDRDLHRKFWSRHVSSYPDLSAMIDDLTRVVPISDEGETGDRVLFGDLSPPIRRQLLDNAGTYWCAVDVAGQIHVFRKKP